MNINRERHYRDRGAVSIFIVIFSALLVTTVVIGFIRLMIQEQQQATATDLSQSALNSAQAGVEDAKRALVRYHDYCQGSSTASKTTECQTLATALTNGQTCDTIQRTGILGGIPGNKEVMIRQSDGDQQLDQAYTCVKVTLDTNDFVEKLTANATPKLIPLKATGGFDEVTIEWYSQDDLKKNADDVNGVQTIDLPLTTDMALPPLNAWSATSNRPPIMRTQLIQFGDTFKLSDFDKKEDGSSNAHTLFLYPNSVGAQTYEFSSDQRQVGPTGALKLARCDETFSSATTTARYACKATLKLPQAVGENSTAYLRVDSVYGDSNFRVTLNNSADTSGGEVKFSSVQPIVDSTGRANDYFRRVQSRIEMDSSTFPFPQATIDLGSDLCKAFRVTDTEYKPSDCDAKTN